MHYARLTRRARTCLFASLLACVSLAAHAAPAREEPDVPFKDKPRVESHIYAELEARYTPWKGGAVPLGKDYTADAFKRERLGTVTIAPGMNAHVDAIYNTVHFPSYVELVDAGSGALLGKYAVFEIDDTRWYFPGNGFAYLSQANLGACGPHYTRKLARHGSRIDEVPQGLIAIERETEVLEPTQLFDAPKSKNVVATVLPKSKVTVLGQQYSGAPDQATALPLLVKTPLGLTGWYRPYSQEGSLAITNCN